MALRSIFDPITKPQQVTIETDDFDTLEIDAIISENHDYTTEITKHEVEEGLDITDNVRKDPKMISLSCVITDTPGTLGSNKILNSINEKPSQNAFDFLTDIYENSKICYIQTSVEYYDTYIMKSFSNRKSIDESGGLFFDLEFEEVRFATAKEGVVDDTNEEDKSTASTKKDRGKQQPVEATAAETAKGDSWLSSILKSAAGL